MWFKSNDFFNYNFLSVRQCVFTISAEEDRHEVEEEEEEDDEKKQVLKATATACYSWVCRRLFRESPVGGVLRVARSSAFQGELSQPGGHVIVQTAIGLDDFRIGVRQQEVARARYVFGKSGGQTRPAPLLELETRCRHQKPANRRWALF